MVVINFCLFIFFLGILGYKMMRGRVESYATVRMIVDLDNSMSPEYEVFYFRKKQIIFLLPNYLVIFYIFSVYE